MAKKSYYLREKPVRVIIIYGLNQQSVKESTLRDSLHDAEGTWKDPISAKATILPFQYRDGWSSMGNKGLKKFNLVTRLQSISNNGILFGK